MASLPALYSFRRCPYAIRARLVLAYAGCRVELREVVLKNKPPAMLAASPKGTVPVLVLADGRVLEESLDIMAWALDQNDPADWRRSNKETEQQEIDRLIRQNDRDFKPLLDRYKYADRYPEQSAESYRSQAEVYLRQLDKQLEGNPFLLGQQVSLADAALFPFIRQFAHVDRTWFDQTPYRNLQAWLQGWLDSEIFAAVMAKNKPWQQGDEPLYFPN